MKKLKSIFLFLLPPLLVFGQSNSIDVWISKINNSSLIGTCQYSWVIVPRESYEQEVTKLVKAGKSVDKKLVKLLTNKDKGIIAHYILSNIHGQTAYTILLMDSVKTVYNYNGLEFIEMNGKMQTDKSKLEKVKEYWEREFKK